MEDIKLLLNNLDYLISELKSIDIINVSESLETLKEKLIEINESLCGSGNNLEELDREFNSSIDDFQNLMVHYGLKTIFTKTLKKKKSTTNAATIAATTTTTTIISSPTKLNNNNKSSQYSILDSGLFISKKPTITQTTTPPFINDSLHQLIKLLALIQMFIIREQQQDQQQPEIPIEPIAFWVGVSTSLKELDECKVKLINKPNIQMLISFLKTSKEYLNCPASYFRIIIDNDIDIKSITQLLDWLKENSNNNKIPINIIVNNPANTNQYLQFFNLNLPISLSSTLPQFNYFINSMPYKSKSHHHNTTTTNIINNKKNRNNNQDISTNALETDSEIDSDKKHTIATQKQQREDDSTDEDSSPHDESYSTSPQFKPTLLDTKTEATILTPKTNRSYTIKNMKASPQQQKTKLFTTNENITPNKCNNNISVNSTPLNQQQQILQHSPTSPSISPSSSSTKLDPSLSRIHYKTSMFSQAKPIGITTGSVTSTQIHLRDALDNPVSTIATSNLVGFGPISSAPLKIQCDGPLLSNGDSNYPIYTFVTGPGILGVSFFPVQHGTYQLSASIDGNPIKNSPTIFKSSSSGAISPNEVKPQQQQQLHSSKTKIFPSPNNTPSSSSINTSNSLEKKRKLPSLDFDSEQIDLLDFVESEFENNSNSEKKPKSNTNSGSNSLNNSINNIFFSSNKSTTTIISNNNNFNNNDHNTDIDDLINNVTPRSNLSNNSDNIKDNISINKNVDDNGNNNNNDFDKKVCDFVNTYNKRFSSSGNNIPIINNNDNNNNNNNNNINCNNNNGDDNGDNTNTNTNKSQEKEEIIESTLLVEDEISPTLQYDEQLQSSSSLNDNNNNSIIVNSNSKRNNSDNIFNEEIEATLPT
ncbi:hypothetical protein DICPUDRAFT_77276 [Dictyostelium purpureum]|uniref:Uncharacterized protein n=1 Tax=Dictyostelium purpureum TaxID=5786 RepID=F0ZG52_DICPU|nr:uncharacterized protein DICPUDRAFT_77276 [Dictyostelium purpureum]EGC37115.1 hypothetical protein DICPUDRAFT_77276 [Dictyostelium purpureum]|eukprot:XP_003286396.1 hypothetical protein DICPUDRAFT_77276 [Dictyostelium purpureum]